MDISKLITQTTGVANKILIYGGPGSGKTTAALTWPNPRVVNFDNNIRKGVAEWPFWDAKFVDAITPRKHPAHPPNRRDALRKWLVAAQTQIAPTDTIIFDSLTSIQLAFDAQENIEPKPTTKNGNVDTLQLFRLRLAFFHEMFAGIQALPCTTIVLAHQQYERGEDGELTSRIKPMLSGQAGDQLPGYFSMVLQALIVDDKDAKPPTRRHVFRVRPSATAPARVTGGSRHPDTDFIPATHAALTDLVKSLE